MAAIPVILVAEDRLDDIELIKRALRSAGVSSPIFFVRDGEETIDYLEGEGKYSNREEYPLPELLLLDLKMPRMDSFDVLAWIRSQPQLGTLRVVVLTSSDENRDINLAYELGANSFLVKPQDFKDFVKLSSFINVYWLRLDKAPEISRSSLREMGEPPSEAG